MNYSSQVVSKNRMSNIILQCQRNNGSKTLVVQQMLQMVIKKLMNNMFRMDMCDNICKKIIIVPQRVTFTSEHRTSKTEQSDMGWWLGGNPGVWILLPFRINLDPTNLDTLIL